MRRHAQMPQLIDELEKQFAESEQLQQQVQANLRQLAALDVERPTNDEP